MIVDANRGVTLVVNDVIAVSYPVGYFSLEISPEGASDPD